MHTCPLCHNQHTRHYFEDKHREYLQCEQCYLVFVNPDQRLDAETEKAHYDLHENNPEDMAIDVFCRVLLTQSQSEFHHNRTESTLVVVRARRFP